MPATFYRRQWPKPSPRKRNVRSKNGCLRRAYKQLRKEEKQKTKEKSCCCSLSRVQLSATPWLQHARLPCPSPTPGAYSNSCPLSQWCHPTISSSVIPFSWLQSFPASGSFLMSLFFASGGLSIRASGSVLPTIIQGWFPLGLTGSISLQSKGLSRVFSNTTVQKHQFFSTQLSLQYNSQHPYMITGKS